jgi:hypothetical protein
LRTRSHLTSAAWLAFGLLIASLPAAVALAAPKAKAKPGAAQPVPESAQAEIRAAYQSLADAYASKDLKAVLDHYAPDYKRTYQGVTGIPAPKSRAELERLLRTQFPGNSHAPAQGYFLRVFKPSLPNEATVVLWMWSVTPIDGRNPQGGNADGSYSVVHRWVKQDRWRVREEVDKMVQELPEDTEQFIHARSR